MILRFLVVFAALLVLPACAQEKGNSKDFKIVYEIEVTGGGDDAMMAAFMPDESVTYVKGNMSRSEMSIAMGMNSAFISNAKTGITQGLFSFMGKKYYFDMDVPAKEDSLLKTTVILKDEFKTICGYKCSKAEIQYEMEGKKYSSFIYYTPQIKHKAVTMAGKAFENIDGLPLEFEIENSGLKMKMIARNIEFKELDSDIFQIPKDYKKVSKEELGKGF